MTPAFFAKQSDFRTWLMRNHNKNTELLVGYYKVGSGKPSITWPQSVDEALCFGWIDGKRKSIDKESYSIRFSPRREKSNWSAVNIKKIEELNKKRKMHPSGLASFEKRELRRSEVYSYENTPVKLLNKFQKKLKENKEAWAFFNSQSQSYQKLMTRWVMTAKLDETKLSRLDKLIKGSAKGTRI